MPVCYERRTVIGRAVKQISTTSTALKRWWTWTKLARSSPLQMCCRPEKPASPATSKDATLR